MLDLDVTYAAIHAELRKPNVGVALCWRVVRLDGSEFYFTDHNETIEESEAPASSPVFEFTSLSSFTGFARKQSSGLNVDNMTVSGFIDAGSPTIGFSEAEVLAEIWADATVTVWLSVWTAISSVGLLPMHQGTLGPMTFRTHSFEAELRGIAERLQGGVHRTYNLSCDAILGGTRCGVALSGSPGFIEAGVVSVVTDRRNFTVDFTGQVADWFQYGLATFTSGDNLGLSREIISHTLAGTSPVTENIILLVPMPFDITPGTTISLTAGCDKRGTTCSGKFNNKDRFRGFDFIPTLEKILEVPDAKSG